MLCPEGGATLAAYRKALTNGLVSEQDEVVLFNCAIGLKSPLVDKSQPLNRKALPDLASL
ncbi:hypothetical protein [Erythrobacter sp.]|uniref:hypothetical protein n=1 Tax=Erythrobacter sp. TaxID=1042 RepID=UPI001B23139C|nr:hypothetical protein [Erythrobacter sp.]MBO6531096.1 hypothetical protein [Erythrobacter sp.]